MNSSNTFNLRGALSAVLAAAIVGTSGLAFDKAHIASAPAGIIEIGQLTPVDVLPQAQVAALPAVIVSAPRGDGRPARAEEGLTMRHIFHRILERYLDGDQIAFDASPRELWPEPKASWHPAVDTEAASAQPERKGIQRVYRELEPQN